jgi:NTE family protein
MTSRWFRRPRLAPHEHGPVRDVFVFTGGGALGAAQVGMVRELLAAGIRPDMVIGCSVGSLNAAYLAADPTLDCARSFEQRWRNLQQKDIFPGSTASRIRNLATRRDYIYDPGPLRNVIRTWLPYGDVADAGIPLVVVSTDLATGTPVFHTSGPVEEVLAASCALPGAFAPVSFADGSLHIDGGVSCLLPIQPAFDAGAERIWVLDVAGGPAGRAQGKSTRPLDLLLIAFGIAMRSQRVNLAAVATDPRVRIISIDGHPVTRGASIVDLSRTPALIQAGADAARAVLRAEPPAAQRRRFGHPRR